MAGAEAEKIVPKAEEKTTTETPKETVHAHDPTTAVEVEIKEEKEASKIEKESEITDVAPTKEEKPIDETPVTVEEKDVKPAAEEEKSVEVKTAE